MRELCAGEISLVQGSGVNFTSPITMGLLNNLADATAVGKATLGAFSVGYAIGTWLNNTFDLSTKIVDELTG